MAVLAGEAWARLARQAGEDLVITTGGLDAGPAAEQCAVALHECGAEYTWLSASEARGRFPGIAVRPGERMLFQPDSGVCLADRAVAALQRLAQQAGVPVRPQSPVLGIEPQGDRVVLRTPAGEISARVAVVTAGAWAEGLLAGAVAHDTQADRHAAAGALLRTAGRPRPVADPDRVAGCPAVLVRRAGGRRRAGGEGGGARARPGDRPARRPVYRARPRCWKPRPQATSATACPGCSRPGSGRRPACTR